MADDSCFPHNLELANQVNEAINANQHPTYRRGVDFGVASLWCVVGTIRRPAPPT
jgi:hypothetical protein